MVAAAQASAAGAVLPGSEENVGLGLAALRHSVLKTNGARFGMIGVGLALLAWSGFVGIAGAQGVIEISFVEELRKIGNEAGYPLDGHYVLTQDIEKSETASWNDGKGFEPIGNEDNRFTGTFDGQEYVIPGLAIHRPDEDYIGLFWDLGHGGVIQNLRLEGGSVSGNR